MAANYQRSSSVHAGQIVVRIQTPNDSSNGQRHDPGNFWDVMFRLTIGHLQSVIDIVSFMR